MKILIIGGGGREHAIAWKCVQSKGVKQVFVAPGNAGTALEMNMNNINIAATDIASLVEFAKSKRIDLTIVGPEAPLALGIADSFQREGLAIFGPTQAATQLESSKAFSKDFMRRHNIPTAHYAAFTDFVSAKNYLAQQKLPIVIKASGLAAGKGVVIAHNQTQAIEALAAMLTDKTYGEAGQEVVIEEFLQGEEASFMVITDGKQVLPLATSQDHKARDNGDQGPNTGGMGAYSPAPTITPEVEQYILQRIIQPTLNGMEQDGIPYQGFLYAGLMLQPDGTVKVLEFNCRLGDPETQPILLRLQSDLAAVCQAALAGKLDQMVLQWDPRPALGVVLAAEGYPNTYQKGDVISGLDQQFTEEVKIFHSGTKEENGRLVTNGGRVLCITALGNTIAEAQQHAYHVADTISWPNVYYRTDIGYRAIKSNVNSYEC